MPINYDFVDPGAIQDKAANRLTSMYNDRARLTAGNAVAAGDYQAGAGALLRSGLTDEGLKLQQQGRAVNDDAATRQGLTAYAGGDFAGARSAFAKGGSLPGVQAADAGQKATDQQRHEVALKLMDALQTDIKAGYDPAQSFDKAAPLFATLYPKAAGDMDTYRQHFIADPTGTIQAVRAATQKELEAFTLKPGEKRFGPNGEEVGAVAAEPKYVAVPEGGKLVPVPTGAPGVAAPATDAPALGATPAPGAEAPRSVRNNNPGNVEDGEFAKSLPGYKGSDGRYAIFETPEAGGQAQVALLQSYGKRGFDTVNKVIGRWAPASDGNPTPAYAKFVADRLGVPADEQLDLSNPQIAQKLAGAIAAFEAGSGSAKPAPAATAAPGDPVGTIYGNPKKTARPATVAEKAAYGISADVPAQMKPDGSIDVINGTGANLKPVPQQIQHGLIGNRTSIQQIDEAIALLQKNPHAMGLKNKLGDDVMQRMDPNGVPIRAAVANIGSLILHDRSGAAVTAAEQPRLMPFIPTPSDTAQTAIQKLQGLKHQYENANAETELAYGSDSGYRPMGGKGEATPGAPAKAAAPAAPKVRVYNPKTGKLE